MKQDTGAWIERERAEAKRDAQWLLVIVLGAATVAVAVITAAQYL